jgi:tRNA guanosine-2'-O-methyltransferase
LLTSFQKSAEESLVSLVRQRLDSGGISSTQVATLCSSFKPLRRVVEDYVLNMNIKRDLGKKTELLKLTSLDLSSYQRSALLARVWRSISEDLDTGDPKHEYQACLIWLRWLDLCLEFCAEYMYVDSDEYLKFLRQGLRRSNPATQKVCLQILRATVTNLSQGIRFQSHEGMSYKSEAFKFDINHRDEYVAQYDRFCSTFETVVLGRYINQVEECLVGLKQSLPCPEDAVFIDPSWWISLFTAALQAGVTDSTRQVVGEWLFREIPHWVIVGPKTMEMEGHYIEFLTDGLLLWASQGHLFSRSILRNNREVSCTHGEALAGFLAQALQNSPKNQPYIKAITRWLAERSDSINLHAEWYILHGLSKIPTIAHSKGDLAWMGLTIMGRAHRMAHYQQLRLAEQCRRMTPDDRSWPDGDPWSVLMAKATLCKDGIGSEFDFDKESVPPLNQMILEFLNKDWTWHWDKFRSTCLKIICALDAASEVKMPSATNMLRLLKKMWEDFETRDCPRADAIPFTRLILHFRVFELADSEIIDFQVSALEYLQDLAERRIWLWNPLALAVRNLAQNEPRCQTWVGHQMDVESFIVRFVNQPPSPSAEFLLDACISKEQALDEHYPDYAADEGLGHACIFDILNQLTTQQSSFVTIDPEQLLKKLVQPWLKQRQPVPMVSKWKRTSQLQAMVILIEHIGARSSNPEKLDEYRRQFLAILCLEPLPRFRFLLEWAIIALTFRLQAIRPTSWSDCPILSNLNAAADQSNPKYLCSLLKLATLIAQHPSMSESYSIKLFQHFITLSISSKIAVRHEAQWSLPILWRHAALRKWTNTTENVMLRSLYESITSLDKYTNPPMQRLLESFNPATDRNLTTLFQGGYFQIDPPEAEILTTEDFEDMWAADDKFRVTSSPETQVLPLGPGKLTQKPLKAIAIPERPRSPWPRPPRHPLTPFIPFQTKGRQILQTSSTKPHNFNDPQAILIASLIDTPYNLGGLSRVSEIFGVTQLHVPNLSVIKSKEFQSTSVSSEGHVNFVCTTTASLLDTLRSLKAQGYTVIGIEQTSTSFVLGEQGKKLPRKAVFVLGAEKTGLPGHVLAEVDECVEIRQWGVTRSLNVQTAGAVVMWEWRRECADA